MYNIFIYINAFLFNLIFSDAYFLWIWENAERKMNFWSTCIECWLEDTDGQNDKLLSYVTVSNMNILIDFASCYILSYL